MIPILYDKTGNVKIGELTNCIECLVEEERNGLFEVSLIYPTNDTLFNSLEEENIIVCNANDTLLNQKFRIYMTRKLMSNRIEVFARHISFDLAYDYIKNIDIEKQSCEYALNTIFRNSQFSTHYKGYSDIINAQDYKVSNVNCIEAIGGTRGSIIDTFGTGAEILRDNTNIHVLNKRGHDNGVSIEYAKNLTGFELEEDYSELITRIIPFASYSDSETNEEILVEANAVDSDLISNYSHPYISYMDFSEKFEDEETPTTEKLVNLAKKYFKNNNCDKPKQNFKIEFVPLSKCVGYEGIEDNISLCDTVTIKDTRYNINTKAKVIKTIFNVLKNRYESMELGEPRTTLGDIINSSGGSGESGEQGPPGPQGPPGADGSIGDFPNSLPSTPVLSANVYGFASIELNWTYENKVYYNYELYGSKTKDFTPNSFDLIHAGQSSSFLFQAKPNEIWYFKVCAINSHGNRTGFSNQVTAATRKIDDMSNYFEDAAIGNAVIGTLTSDYMEAGIIKGHYIDAKNLSVTDGNGKRTLNIDSYGNVDLYVSKFSLKGQDVATSGDLDKVKDIIRENKGLIEAEIDVLKGDINNQFDEVSKETEQLNKYIDTAFKDDLLSETELAILKDKINKANEEKVGIDNQYFNIMNNINLVDDVLKNNLIKTKDNYDKAYSSFLAILDNATKDVLNGESTDIVSIKNKVFTKIFKERKLGGTTVPQSFYIDFKNNIIYVTQVRKAIDGNVRINRLDITGKLLDNMIVLNCGHGSNIAFDGEYIYMEADPYYNESSNMSHGRKIGRVKYIPNTEFDMASIKHYDPLPGHTGLLPTLFDNNNKICIKSSFGGKEYYTSYNFSKFKNKVYEPINQFSKNKVDTSFQGFAIDNNIVYIHEGTSNNVSSNKIHAYTIDGSYLYSENVNINDNLTFREAEGIQAITNGNINTLYIGFADGESSNRNFNLYKLDKIKTNYEASINECINKYVNEFMALKELLIEAVDSIGDYKAYQSEVSSKDYINEKVTEINVTTDGISQIVSNIQKSHQAQYGDISRLRIKANYIDLNSENQGEIYLYGVDEKGNIVSKGGAVEITLQGKKINYIVNHLNPHYGGIDWGCPLNELVYIVYDVNNLIILGVWPSSKSSTGWYCQDILGDNILLNKTTEFEWKSYHAIIGDFKLSGNELVKECNLYKQATDSSLLKQLTTRSELKQTSDSISLEVSKKVGIDNIISSINQTAEKVQIQANKINLSGAVTVENNNGDSVKINNGDYEIKNGSTTKGFFGLKEVDEDKAVPRLVLGANGISYLKDDYLTIQAQPKGNNPQGISYSYVDIGFRCQEFKNSSGYGDVSNIKMYGDGVTRLSPIKKLEITTNFKNGKYNGEGENLIAEFGSSSSSYYDKYMDIPAIRNTQTTNGLILAHRNANDQSCFVRVNCDTNGERFFRPLTTDGNISLGSGNYQWKSVHSKTTYSSAGVVANDIEVRAVNNNDILDNINFISPLNGEEELIIDVTNIKNTNYVDSYENNVYLNNNEIIKLLLKEVKQLKEELNKFKRGKY